MLKDRIKPVAFTLKLPFWTLWNYENTFLPLDLDLDLALSVGFSSAFSSAFAVLFSSLSDIARAAQKEQYN